MTKLVYGVGVNDGKYPTNVNGKIPKSYSLWMSLLTRCFRPEKRSRAYTGCSVSENFKNYSYFHNWCQNQIGFGQEGFELDKDLLFKGNKLYSEDTCLFIPSRLNKLLLTSDAIRGSLPLGVSAHGKRFKAQCLREPASPHIGVFNTPEEAFNAYKQVKEAIIKAQAEKWKAHVDPRAFIALMVYEVSISD